MKCTVTEETFDWFASFWESRDNNLRWDTVFVLPPWLRVWQAAFAPQSSPSFLVAREGESVIGIAPLLIVDGKASVAGSPDVCDYADFVVAPGKETIFSTALLDALKHRGVRLLDLRSVRPDSTAVSSVVEAARARGYDVASNREDVSLETDLPPTWEAYLGLLSSKQRHEVRRKLRRLEEAGSVSYRFIEDSDAVPGFMDTFLAMFVESRDDKAAFMTGDMEAFFRSMATAMSRAGLLRLGVLDLDEAPVAAIITFDFNDVIYLYNSAFDPEYRSLSVGVLSKVLCLKDSIERGKKRFDFLKGDERYKYHLGGQEVELHRYQIAIA